MKSGTFSTDVLDPDESGQALASDQAAYTVWAGFCPLKNSSCKFRILPRLQSGEQVCIAQAPKVPVSRPALPIPRFNIARIPPLYPGNFALNN